MKKGTKKWINDLSCTLRYKGETRKCFGHNFNHIRMKITEAVRRQWKLWANFASDNFHQVSDTEWHGHFICTTGERINYTIIDRKDRIKEAARLLGQVGGMAGTGKKKVRGDSNYYKLLRAKRTLKDANKTSKNDK